MTADRVQLMTGDRKEDIHLLLSCQNMQKHSKYTHY